MCVIVCDSDGCQISEQGQEDNELGTDSLADDDHGGDEVDFQMQAESDTVLDICLHTLENLTSDLDGRDNGGETGGEEDDISGGLSGLSGTLDSDTAIRFLERWSIVDTVTSHGGQMSTLLQHLDDLVLVFRENLSETISLLNEIVLGCAGETAVDEFVRVVDLSTESQHLASFLCDGNGITSQHLNGETKNLSFSDGGCGILTGRVEHGKHAEELPWSITFLDSNTERSETTSSELGSLGLVHIGIFLGAFSEVQNGLGGTLSTDKCNAILLDNSGDTLGDRIERSEFVGSPSLGKDVLGFWVSLQGEDGDFVNWIEGLNVVGGGESSNGHHPVDINTFSDERLADGQLIGCERTGLVGTENIDTLE